MLRFFGFVIVLFLIRLPVYYAGIEYGANWELIFVSGDLWEIHFSKTFQKRHPRVWRFIMSSYRSLERWFRKGGFNIGLSQLCAMKIHL